MEVLTPCFVVIGLFMIATSPRVFAFPASHSVAAAQMEFPFVHPSIAEVLSCKEQLLFSNKEEQWEVDPVTLEIRPCFPIQQNSNKFISNESLIELAHKCDKLVFGSSPQDLPFRESLQGLVRMCFVDGEQQPSQVLVATLLGINALESAIRRVTGHSTGRAPLLKQMLAQIHNVQLAMVLQTLLLPTPGLNLRNLLWHGCVASLPRSWLALVLVLTFQLEKDLVVVSVQEEESLPLIVPLKDYPIMTPVLDRGEELMHMTNKDFINTVNDWLPPSHRELWNLTITLIKNRQAPACVAALMSILLEHGLRQDWCRANIRPQDAIARPGAYFVTLDGHGQRHQHDLLLHPYIVVDDSSFVANKIVSELGGGTMALLTDLFCSSSGGPNIRAALAHGLWDVYLEEDMMNFGKDGATKTKQASSEGLWDVIRALCTAMEGAAHSPSLALRQYRPIFSFSATTVRNAQEAMSQLKILLQCKSSEQWFDTCSVANDQVVGLSELHVPLEYLKHESDKVLSLCGGERGDMWQAEDLMVEHDCNVQLSSCTAARTLLSDVATATATLTDAMENALVGRSQNNLSSRQRRRLHRLYAAAGVATTMYSFFIYVALLSIQQQLRALEESQGSNSTQLSPNVLLKAVERSRMCVSTMATFLISNSERAFKAANDYAKGKAVKAILHYKTQTVG